MIGMVVWAPFIAAAAALSGVWLQSYLSRRQTFINRLWDLKREAYGEILAAMTEAENECVEILHALQFLSPADVQPATGSTPQLTKVIDRFLVAAREARRRFARDNLILPPDFVQLYLEFAAESRKLDVDTSVSVQRVEQMQNLISSYRPRLEKAAREDLMKAQ